MRIHRAIAAIGALCLLALPATVQSAANQAPTAVVNPPSGAPFNAPATIVLSATASDSDGTVASVQFFRGGTTAIGPVLTTAPFTYTWTNVAAGTYSITAKPIDNQGKAGTSNTISVTVSAVTTVITSPAAGATVNAGVMQVTGTFTGPTTSTVLVTGGANDSVVATLVGGTFSASVEMVEGSNVIEVQVARPDGTSEFTSRSVTGIAPPLVAITSPNRGGSYCAPASVAITAEAATNQGTIKRVEFSVDGGSPVSVTSPPYVATVQLATAASHSVVARAVSSFDLVTDSAALVLNAGSLLPTVAITTPANNSSFRVGTAIPVQATASDPDGTVARVDYLFTTTPPSATAAPYAVTWTPMSAATYQLVARAIDNCGATKDSAPISVTITNDLPTVQLTSPAANVNAIAPASVDLAATASDPDGIKQVEFISNGLVVFTDTAPPYEFQLQSLGVGNYTVSAKAYDNFDAVSQSVARTISVTAAPANQPPTVSIDSPVVGSHAVVPASFAFTASASDSDGIDRVEFFVNGGLVGTKTTLPYGLTLTLSAGDYVLKATAYDRAATPAQSSISMQYSVLPPVSEIVTYLHTDIVGSPIAATDASGSVLWKERYRPFGQRLTNDSVGASNSQWFGGKTSDTETGLSYFGARYYDPVVGRFNSTDPVQFQEGNLHSFSRYAYGNNNPYKYVDPDGKNAALAFCAGGPVPCAIGIGLTVATAYYGAEAVKGTLRALNLYNESAGESESKGESASGGEAPKGTANGTRAGKPFTPKGKAEIDAENADRNGGANQCENCGQNVVPGEKSQKGVRPPGNERQRDHIVPQSKGGDGDPSNGQILCRDCNLGKGNQSP